MRCSKSWTLLMLISFLLTLGICLQAMARSPYDNINAPYYQIKVSIFKSMPRQEGAIVFLGDSLTDYVKFEELLPDLHIKNRGIAGDSTLGTLLRIDEVISLKPSKLFVLLGTNDIVLDIKTDETIQNLRQIIEKVREALPDTRIYLETLFPVNHQFETGRPTDTILAINDRLPKLAEKTNCTLIDTYSRFAENGEMPSRYTVDGVHLNGTGVTRWIEFLTPWIRE